MKEYLLDANFILRFWLDDHKTQSAIATDIFKNAHDGKVSLYITNHIVCELEYVLRKVYKVDKHEINSLIESLVSNKFIKTITEAKKEILLEALSIQQSKYIDLSDCLLIAISKNLGIEVLTFDQDLLNLRAK